MKIKRFIFLLLLLSCFVVKAQARPPTTIYVTNYVNYTNWQVVLATNYVILNNTNWVYETKLTLQTNFVYATNYIVSYLNVTNYVNTTNATIIVQPLWAPPNPANITNLNVWGNLIANPSSTNAGEVVTLSMGTNVTGHLP